MGLKKRLVAAFLILLFVPVLLITGTGLAIVRYQTRLAESSQAQESAEDALYYIDEGSETAETRVSLPFFRAIFMIAVVIVCTATILVFWLYGSIIRPLNVLTEATRSMQEGNLDFTISGDPGDELGQLCRDFENMRIKLKETIDARLKYESDTVELISNISHDLKTPLTAIKGYAEGIMDGVADTPEKRDKYLRTIYNKATDMQVLVDELSFYSKIDSNIVPYNFSRLDINGYFGDCVEELSLDMEVKNISLTYESDIPDGCLVVADPEQLRRVVNNIIGNSVKYMDKAEGSVSIRTRDAGDLVRIEIEDNGSGVDEADLPHLFERFYRADASRGSRNGGTGLGLAIAHKIIEDHGGTISASSSKGIGTKIIFTLPKAKPDEVHCDDIEDAEYIRVQGKRRRNRDRKHV